MYVIQALKELRLKNINESEYAINLSFQNPASDMINYLKEQFFKEYEEAKYSLLNNNELQIDILLRKKFYEYSTRIKDIVELLTRDFLKKVYYSFRIIQKQNNDIRSECNTAMNNDLSLSLSLNINLITPLAFKTLNTPKINEIAINFLKDISDVIENFNFQIKKQSLIFTSKSIIKEFYFNQIASFNNKIEIFIHDILKGNLIRSYPDIDIDERFSRFSFSHYEEVVKYAK